MARNINFSPGEKVEKALDVFWDKGYTATSLQDLTDAMEINKSSLYNLFHDKHSLFVECLKAYGSLTTRDFKRATRDKSLSPLQLIDSIIDEHAKVTVERKRCCFAVKTSFEMGPHDAEIHQMLQTGNHAMIQKIIDLVKAAQEKGEIKKERNATLMGHFIFDSFGGWGQSYILYQDKSLIEGMANELKAYTRF